MCAVRFVCEREIMDERVCVVCERETQWKRECVWCVREREIMEERVCLWVLVCLAANRIER